MGTGVVGKSLEHFFLTYADSIVTFGTVTAASQGGGLHITSNLIPPSHVCEICTVFYIKDLLQILGINQGQ